MSWNSLLLHATGRGCVNLFSGIDFQHHRIISLQSSRGLSPTYLFLMACSSFSTLTNALILQFPYLGCCVRVVINRVTNNVLLIHILTNRVLVNVQLI